jgi:hypothetical protein
MKRRLVLALVLLTGSAWPLPAAGADIPAAALDPYLQIQTALAGDSLDSAKAAAKTFTAQAGKLGPAFQKALSAAEAITAAADIKAARTAFGDLSDAVLTMAGDGSGGAGVRVAYCPMVKKSWLQKGSEIANPYYGSQMLRCGEFKK